MKIKGVRGELYFHVLQPNRRLRYGDGRVVEPGSELKAKTQYTTKGTPRKIPMECQFGMHGCTTAASSALEGFWTGYWICIVRLWGNVRTFGDKSAALRRKVVAMRQIGEDGDYPPARWYGDEEVYNWVMAKPYKGVK